MPMVMKGLKEEKIGDGILHTVLSVFVCVCVYLLVSEMLREIETQ